jgi:hypothetical protein
LGRFEICKTIERKKNSSSYLAFELVGISVTVTVLTSGFVTVTMTSSSPSTVGVTVLVQAATHSEKGNFRLTLTLINLG